ncbi:MAG TPA: tetratricopeptide repeat protein [Chitinispirillaceae bacterium]|nr:tetratricopeptide repeat protein [Chitinispirillaceae bacterium]
MKVLFTAAVISVTFIYTQASFSANKPVNDGAKAEKMPVVATEQPAAQVPADSSVPPIPANMATAPGADSVVAQPATETAPPAPVEKEVTAQDLLKQGDLFAKKKQTEKAMEAYKQCIEKAGDDTAFGRAVLFLGNYYYGKKMYIEALPLLVKVTGKNAETMPFKVMLAATQLAAGSPDSAIAILEPIASNQKIPIASRKDMFKIIGDAYLKLKQNDKAVFWYSKHIAAGGAKTADMAYMVAFEGEKTAPAKAKSAYESNIKSFPKDYRNYVRLGILNARARATLPAALGLLKKAITLSGDSIPSIWLEIGKVNASLGKKDDAIESYRACLRGDQNNLEAKVFLGSALFQKGSTEEAISYFENAHKQAPDSIAPMVGLSSAYVKINDTKKAIEILEKLKNAQPKDIEVRKELIRAFKSSGQEKKAAEEVTAALEVEHDPELLIMGAKTYLAIGKLDDAAILLEEMISMDPYDIETLMTMGKVKHAQGKLDEAIQAYKDVNAVDPKYSPSLYQLGQIFLEQSKVKWAEMYYQRAITADPNYALAEVGLARIQLLFKNNKSFEEHLAKANSLAPNDQEVQKAIKEARNPKKAAVASAPAVTATAKTGNEAEKTGKTDKKDKKRK